MLKASWAVLRADKELLWLPVISMVASAVIGGLFVVPVLLTTHHTVDAEGVSHRSSVSPAGWVAVFVGYLVLSYITIFFNTALICAADQRMRGGDPTLSSALADARARAGAILPWAILSATVSVVLKAVQERVGIIGKIVAGLAGLAWTLVTFLVLPIVALERVGVGVAIKRSAELFKRTWGEQVVGNLGVGLVGFLGVLCAIPVVIIGAVIGGPLLWVCIAAAVVWFIVLAAVVSALSVVYQTALYHYAVQGAAPAAFASVDLAHAFVAKKRRLGRS
jgi:hypothetical protein